RSASSSENVAVPWSVRAPPCTAGPASNDGAAGHETPVVQPTSRARRAVPRVKRTACRTKRTLAPCNESVTFLPQPSCRAESGGQSSDFARNGHARAAAAPAFSLPLPEEYDPDMDRARRHQRLFSGLAFG